MTEHTPAPWSEPYQDDYPGDQGWWIYGNRGKGEYAIACTFVLNPNQEADARFIVRACNAHDDLLAALETMVSVFRPREEPGPDTHVETEAWAMAQAAITKARR